VKLYDKTNNEEDKKILREKIDILTNEINNLNFKIQMCRIIIKNLKRLKKKIML